ncbi:MAG: diacylglycerol kinase [Holosporales bacterium]|nr:diacylglycerol kinase [Holosporales bacterium]
MSFRLGWRDALLNSVSGIRFLISERAFRQELYVGLVLIAVELFRSSSVFMLLYIFASYFLVLLMEAVNSAIETTIDRIGLERHPLSKKAKDIGSAAVLISIIHLCIAWMTSFFL